MILFLLGIPEFSAPAEHRLAQAFEVDVEEDAEDIEDIEDVEEKKKKKAKPEPQPKKVKSEKDLWT
ncbi:hypothetical protein ACFL2F_04210, partial [Myxococcota bacterium]